MESAATTTSATGRAVLLRDDLLAPLLGGFALDRESVLETGSTNADLIARARLRAPARPVLRVAQRQTQGRGRRGRRWHGSDAGSLLFSLALPWRLDPAASAAVTLACGIAVAQALRSEIPEAGTRIRVKWPNDILLDAGKLAGILVELAEDGAGRRTLVIGLGINLASDAALHDRIGAEDAGAAGGLAPAELATLHGAEAVLARREFWLACLVRALLDAALRFEDAGFAGGPEAFAACCAYAGTAVEIHGAGAAQRRGILRGVDAQGRLLLESAGALQAVNSGEISVRPAPASIAAGRA